ncbi:unnamed protein product [Urochloa humidicola]
MTMPRDGVAQGLEAEAALASARARGVAASREAAALMAGVFDMEVESSQFLTT